VEQEEEEARSPGRGVVKAKEIKSLYSSPNRWLRRKKINHFPLSFSMEDLEGGLGE
jgi:hypothetical protein